MGYTAPVLLLLIPILIAYYTFSGYTINDESLKGKKILVTGASAGIGEEVAYRYARAGARLMLTARRQELLEKVAQKCKELGAASVSVVSADMGVPSGRTKVFQTTEKQLGELDILILNHALIQPSKFVSIPTKDYMQMLNKTQDVNFISYVHLTSLFLPTLEKSQGSIGVVSSLGGKIGILGMNHYIALKHALQGFYASLRQELRYKKTSVSVTLIVYGGVDSEQSRKAAEKVDPTALKRLQSQIAKPNDAAEALVGGVQAKAYEVYFPTSAHILALMNRFIPHGIEDFVSWLYGDIMYDFI